MELKNLDFLERRGLPSAGDCGGHTGRDCLPKVQKNGRQDLVAIKELMKQR